MTISYPKLHCVLVDWLERCISGEKSHTGDDSPLDLEGDVVTFDKTSEERKGKYFLSVSLIRVLKLSYTRVRHVSASVQLKMLDFH